ALPDHVFETVNRVERQTSLASSRGNRARQGVLRKLLEACGKTEYLRFVELRIGEDDLRHLWPAFCQRPGLVEHHDVDLLAALQSLAILNENSVPRAEAGPDHN